MLHTKYNLLLLCFFFFFLLKVVLNSVNAQCQFSFTVCTVTSEIITRNNYIEIVFCSAQASVFHSRYVPITYCTDEYVLLQVCV